MTTAQNIQFPGGLNRRLKTGENFHSADTDPERLVWYFASIDEAQQVSSEIPGSRISSYRRGLCIALGNTILSPLLGRDGNPVWPGK